MWVITVQQAESGDMQNIDDGRGHDGEEGDTREHPEQSQPSDKQQECWESKHRWQVCDYQVVRCHKMLQRKGEHTYPHRKQNPLQISSWSQQQKWQRVQQALQP